MPEGVQRSASLAAIIALARSGALDQAWSLLGTAGAEGSHDPSGIVVRARLLKDRAIRAVGEERRRLYNESAAAYRRAAEMGRATYPLINAATLSLLGGEPAQAASLGELVLSRVELEPDEPETPYWRSATRAEALLLLDREEEARAAFAEAIALAPRAWEDHASTLRQFRLILEAQGRDAAWLDGHRPPRSLHFAGHMSFDAKVERRAHLDDRIRAILDKERVNFGYGALAAGADIIVAEALLERGAELHAVLPGGAEAFAATSVDPFGKAWRKRFDAVLAAAETVRTVAPAGTPPDRAMVRLGDEIALGTAAMNAARLESEALQLLVLSDGGEEEATSPIRRRIVTAPREAPPPDAAAPLAAAAHRCLAVLTVAAADAPRLAALAPLLAGAAGAAVPPYFTGSSVVLAYASPTQAADAACILAAAADAAVGGHYGIVEPLADPFAGGLRIGGEAAALASAAAASAPAGSVCVTADFASALAAAGEGGIRAESVGELESGPAADPVGLYALRRRS